MKKLCILILLVPMMMFAQEMTEKEAQEELAMIQEQLAEAEATISALDNEVEGLESEVVALEDLKDEYQTKLDEVMEIWRRCQYGRYKVIEGDWLCTIAAKRNVYSACSKWPMIFEANKDKIKDANLIYPGWVLLIPTLDEYTVKSGDYLSFVASYLSIYSNAKRWPEIYEANKDKIKDPDWIYPKQKFVIPHE